MSVFLYGCTALIVPWKIVCRPLFCLISTLKVENSHFILQRAVYLNSVS